MSKSALGKGLSSLIPQRNNAKEEIFFEGRTEVLEISVEEIEPNPRQPRQQFSASDLEDLLNSIKEHGVLLPLVVTKKTDGLYELISGERRLRASKMLGKKTVPAIVRKASEQQKLELALIENIQRQDLNPLEEAIAYQALLNEFQLTQEEIALRVGKSRSVVANMLRLLELPIQMQEALAQGKISKSHARTLLAEKEEKKRQQLFNDMLSEKISVRSLEKAIGGKSTKILKKDNPNIREQEKRLREFLGTKVSIQEKNGRGRILIDFYSEEELKNIIFQFLKGGTSYE